MLDDFGSMAYFGTDKYFARVPNCAHRSRHQASRRGSLNRVRRLGWLAGCHWQPAEIASSTHPAGVAAWEFVQVCVDDATA
jgi:hypothetical protein